MSEATQSEPQAPEQSTEPPLAEIPEEGQLWTSEVARVGEEEVFFDGPAPFELVGPLSDFIEPPSVGEAIEVFVDQIRSHKVTVSPRKARYLKAWNHLAAAKSESRAVKGTVIGAVKGGYAIKVEVPFIDHGLRGFFPGTRLEARPLSEREARGRTYEFKIDKLQKSRFNLIVERREALKDDIKKAKAQLLESLSEGVVVEGVVQRFAEFGAFVDLGGLSGLLHLSEMTWGRPGRPEDHLRVGQKISVKVIAFDKGAEKIGLSYRQTQPDPWEGIEERFPLGSKVSGRVTGMTDYGAFIGIAPGIEGLLHVSELSWTQEFKHPREALSKGDELLTQVLDIDVAQRRLSLGLRQLSPNPWHAFAEAHPEGSTVEGVVRNITDFGLFLRVDDSLDGLVHAGEMSWTERYAGKDEIAAVFKKKQRLQAKVLQVDAEGQRLSLSLRALQENPWEAFAKKYPRGSTVEGRCTRTNPKGAEFEVAPGILGFCPKDQLGPKVERVEDVVTKEQGLELVVLRIDPKAGRLLLSHRALTEGLDDDYRDYMQESDGGLGNKLEGLAGIALKQ